MLRSELEQAILDFVNRPGYQPLKPRQIAKRLQLPKERVAEVKLAVKGMLRRGELAYGANHLVRPALAVASKGNRVMGVFRRTQQGFGFVRPSGVAADRAEVQDIYIPAKKTADAANGDLVLVQLGRSRGRFPGPRGEIVEVVKRETHKFVGTYLELHGTGYVQVDGTLFAQPILVGDPGSKGAQPDDKVVMEMVRFPSLVHEGEGVITEVLGPRGKTGIDTLLIMREFDLPEQFAEDALDEARREADRFGDGAVLEDRRDLTGETVITIDPIDARDFDDAISLERLENGHWMLGVHIADVSHFVRPNSALDREAQQRATSVYLPDRVVPMLPEVISNSLASLQPKKNRLTKSAFIEFTPEGQRVAVDLAQSVIKSSRRLTYEQVDEYLLDPAPWQHKLGSKVHALLGRMHELAMILRRRRLQRGALVLNMPEVKVDLDKQGRVAGAHLVRDTESHQIIEEFMLAANEGVAEFLHDRGIPFLRRVHKSPSPRKLDALTEFVRALGLKVASLQSRFELQELLDQVVGRPEQYAVHFATLRSLQRAVYGPEEEGHFALASECYCHFTSPIRRYPDLTVHRLVDAVLSNRKPASDFDELVLLGQHCSDREQRAEAAERDLTKLKLLYYLRERIGMEMDALVTGVESFGLFVQGVELPAEGLIHADSLVDDYYRFDRSAHALVGYRSGHLYRLGDPLRVAVARVDLERRELDLRLLQRRSRPMVAEPTKPIGRRSPKRRTEKNSGRKSARRKRR